MGHLFAAGGKTMDGDGVRELYVGSLAHVGNDIFPDCIDYVALGHLHVPQQVGGSEHIRYSGSPIAMGYGEAKQEKKVILVEFKNRTPQIQECIVPCFQALERLTGTMDEITDRIAQLKSEESYAWLEIEYTGKEIVGELLNLSCYEAIAETNMEIRRIKNKRTVERLISQLGEDETLDDLDMNDVFIRCLDSYEVLSDERPELIQSYKEIIASLYDEDKEAE
jgi:exonuclease SbcD